MVEAILVDSVLNGLGEIGLSLTAAEEQEFASGAIGFTGLSAA